MSFYSLLRDTRTRDTIRGEELLPLSSCPPLAAKEVRELPLVLFPACLRTTGGESSIEGSYQLKLGV